MDQMLHILISFNRAKFKWWTNPCIFNLVLALKSRQISIKNCICDPLITMQVTQKLLVGMRNSLYLDTSLRIFCQLRRHFVNFCLFNFWPKLLNMRVSIQIQFNLLKNVITVVWIRWTTKKLFTVFGQILPETPFWLFFRTEHGSAQIRNRN